MTDKRDTFIQITLLVNTIEYMKWVSLHIGIYVYQILPEFHIKNILKSYDINYSHSKIKYQ